MKRLARSAVVLGTVGLLGVASWGPGPYAWGQAAPAAGGAGAAATTPVPPAPDPIPAEARTSTAPEAFRPRIEAFIKGNLVRVKSSDPKVYSAGRDALVAEVASPSTGSSFKDLFAQTLVVHLGPLLDDKDARVRLQAAVVAGRVADRVDNAQLAPVAVKLLKDSNVGLQIWGMKVARGVLSAQLAAPSGLANSPLPKAVVDTVLANPKRQEFARDAADVLHVDLATIIRLKITPATSAQLIAPALRVLDMRAGLYKDGFPEELESDRSFLTFFSNHVWGSLTPAQRVQVTQRAFDILLRSTAAASAATDAAASREMVDHAIRVSRNLQVIASEVDRRASTPATKAFVTAASAIGGGASGANLPPAAVVEAGAKAMLTAAKAIPEFKDLKAP